MTSRPLPFALTLSFASLLAACASTDHTGLLHAVVWTQTAVEREVACAEVFHAATAAMLASTERKQPDGKPFAVIVDVDETVLDNAPYQASLVRDQSGYDDQSWLRWCRAAQAAAIPGAVDFGDACRARGVTIFYITNRSSEVRDKTRENLIAAGLPVANGIETVLTRDAGAPSSKQARRDLVAQTHAVVLLVGDDLNDFVDAEATVEQRRLQARHFAGEWSTRWFLVPNALYGSWERAVVGDEADKLAAKWRWIAPWK